jgi:hypothetical protein
MIPDTSGPGRRRTGVVRGVQSWARNLPRNRKDTTMITRTALLMSLMMAVAACGSDGDAEKKGKAAEPATEPSATADEAPAAQPAKSDQAPAAAKATAAKDDGWQPFEDDTFGFSIDAPMQPKMADQPTPTANGMITSKTYMFSSPTANGAMLVMVTPGDEDTTFDFDEAVRASMATMGGTLLEQKEIEIDGHPGRDLRFSAAPQGHKAQGRLKMVVRDGTVLQAIMIHVEKDERLRADGNRFVDSFTLTAAKDG